MITRWLREASKTGRDQVFASNTGCEQLSGRRKIRWSAKAVRSVSRRVESRTAGEWHQCPARVFTVMHVRTVDLSFSGICAKDVSCAIPAYIAAIIRFVSEMETNLDAIALNSLSRDHYLVPFARRRQLPRAPVLSRSDSSTLNSNYFSVTANLHPLPREVPSH